MSLPPFPAGLGWSRILPDHDFETFSEAGMVWDGAKWRGLPGASAGRKGLQIVGAPVYSEHPSTEVLSYSYDLKDGRGPRVWLPGMRNPDELFDYLARGGLLEAWNTGFERLIWQNVCRRRYGWPDLPIRQLRCAMAKSRAHGLPGKMELAGQVLALDMQKDKDGARLLEKFSKPRNPTKADLRRRITPRDDPADGARLIGYNITDIKAEAAISAQCPDLEGEELEFWLADQAINARGVHIDRKGVEDCIAIVEQAHEKYNAELMALTGGIRASELQKLTGWLHGRGVHMDSMDEDAIEAALARDSLPPEARRALEIRQAIGSASVKKVYAMNLQVCADDRLRDLFSYHAARTGRPTGNGPQPTNLPKAGPLPDWDSDKAEKALEVLATRSLSVVEAIYGDAMLTVSGVLRSLFNAAPGHDLICSDYSAIEAVVLAALAGEQWRLEVFRAGRDIYIESASRLLGIAPEQVTREIRQKTGKTGELASGFGGWVGSWRAFGAEGTDDEIKGKILAWRAASPAIVELWGGQSRDFGRRPGMFGLEGAAVSAVLNRDVPQPVMRTDGTHSGITYLMRGEVLYCTLPSGRHLAYHRPRLSETGTWRGYRLTFEGYNTNAKKGPPGWQTMDLYGGLLAENCISEGTEVLTGRGWVPIEQIKSCDLIHDGLDLCSHGGILSKSIQSCIAVDGVWMTPDHEVLTDDGWIPARENPRPYRPKIWNLDRHNRIEGGREKTKLALSVRLRRVLLEGRHGGKESRGQRTNPELRMSHESAAIQSPAHPRYEQASSLRGMALDDRSVHAADASSVAQLWRAGHHSVRRMAGIVRSVLARHGPDVYERFATGAARQLGGVLARQLRMGDSVKAGAQPSDKSNDRHPRGSNVSFRSRGVLGHRGNDDPLSIVDELAGLCAVRPTASRESRVFDIVNCGPRQRFVVRGASQPFIVHNCTQATARDIQRHAIVNLERAGYPVVLHVYDEDVSEVPEGFGSIEEFERIIGTMPAWAQGWPIRANGGWRKKRYCKS